MCNLWWMSDKVPQGRDADPEQPLSRGQHDLDKSNVEFTFFNLVIRLSNLPRVLLICQPFQMCTGLSLDWKNHSKPFCLPPFPTWSCFLVKILKESINRFVIELKTTLTSSPSYSIKSGQLDDITTGSGLQVVFILFGFW